MHLIFCDIRLLRKYIIAFQQVGEEPLRHSLIYVVLRLYIHMCTFQNILGVLYNNDKNDRKSLSCMIFQDGEGWNFMKLGETQLMLICHHKLASHNEV